MAWYILIAVLGICCGLAASLKPWEKLREQKQETQEARNTLKDAEKERADLIRKQMKYESVAGREVLAREHGYKYPREAPLIDK